MGQAGNHKPGYMGNPVAPTRLSVAGGTRGGRETGADGPCGRNMALEGRTGSHPDSAAQQWSDGWVAPLASPLHVEGSHAPWPGRGGKGSAHHKCPSGPAAAQSCGCRHGSPLALQPACSQTHKGTARAEETSGDKDANAHGDESVGRRLQSKLPAGKTCHFPPQTPGGPRDRHTSTISQKAGRRPRLKAGGQLDLIFSCSGPAGDRGVGCVEQSQETRHSPWPQCDHRGPGGRPRPLLLPLTPAATSTPIGDRGSL